MSQSRREALITIAGAAALSQVQAQSVAATPVLSAEEVKWVASLVDAIIPRTDTPGASDAGVPAFIQRRLAASEQLASRFRAGMSALDSASTEKFERPFNLLDAEQKTVVLTAQQDTEFFRMVKAMTVDGYYSSKAGLVEELGYHGNTFLTEFKGCTHPEHQA